MKRIKYQTVKVDLPEATTVGTYEFVEALDQAFERCIGVTLIPIATNEDDIIRVALKDDSDTYINAVSADFLAVERSTPVKDRVTAVDFRAKGNRLTILVQVTAVLTARNAFDFVYHLHNGPQNTPPNAACTGTCHK